MNLSARSLQQYSLFGGVSEAAIDDLLQYMGQVNFRAGETIFAEGDQGAEICFILQGRVRVEKAGVVLAELGRGDQFGEMFLMDPTPRSADVVGVESGSLVRISHRNLHRMSRKDPQAFQMLLMNCSREIGRRLRRMNERFVESRSGQAPPSPGGAGAPGEDEFKR